MNRTLLDAALSYACRGWPVLPIHGLARDGCECRNQDCGSPGKHPMVSGGFHNATTDADQVAAWWSRWPCANIGLRTGLASTLWVLDVDPRHGGDESFAELEADNQPLPDTWECLTGGDGRHIYFRWRPGGPSNSSGKLGSGLDVRGEGGYIVLPPSRHIAGRDYQWESSSHPDDIEVAETPSWLLDLAARPTPSEPARVTADGSGAAWRQLLEPIPNGRRNATLVKIGGWLHRHHRPGELRALLAVINHARCDPPLDDTEVETIASSVLRYKKGGVPGFPRALAPSDWVREVIP